MWIEAAAIIVTLLLALIATTLFSINLWRKLDQIERGARDALQALQYQVAFIAGAMHLRPRELKQAAAQAAGNPVPDDVQTEVVGGDGWNDIEETLIRFERGELDYDSLQDAEKAIIDGWRQHQKT